MRAGWCAVLGAGEQQCYLLLEDSLAVGIPLASASINKPSMSSHCYFTGKKAKADVCLLKSVLIDYWITGTNIRVSGPGSEVGIW